MARTLSATANCATTHTPDGPRVAAGSSSECRIVRDILSQLGDKWTLMVILCLSSGRCASTRSNELSWVSRIEC